MEYGLVPERLPRVNVARAGEIITSVLVRKMAMTKAPAKLLPWPTKLNQR